MVEIVGLGFWVFGHGNRFVDRWFGFLAHSLYKTHRRRRIIALLLFFVFVKLSPTLRSSSPLTPYHFKTMRKN